MLRAVSVAAVIAYSCASRSRSGSELSFPVGSDLLDDFAGSLCPRRALGEFCGCAWSAGRWGRARGSGIRVARAGSYPGHRRQYCVTPLLRHAAPQRLRTIQLTSVVIAASFLAVTVMEGVPRTAQRALRGSLLLHCSDAGWRLGRTGVPDDRAKRGLAHRAIAHS